MSKFIIGHHSESYNLSYTDRCIKLNLLPLSYRREVADLLHMFKYLRGNINVEYPDIFKFATQAHGLRSSSDPLCLSSTYVRTENYKCFYFNRIVRLWNALPFSLRSVDSVATFKAGVLKFYFCKLDFYDINDKCSLTSNCRCNECVFKCISMY